MVRVKFKTLVDAEAKATEIEDSLSAYDFAGSTFVHIRTHEKYQAEIPNAFVLTYGEWYIIFAEHHNPICFHKDDVEEIWYYSPIRGIKDAKDFKPKDKKKGK